MAGLRCSMGKTLTITTLALMLNACATQKIKTIPQSEYLPDTIQGMACEEFVRYPIATRGVWSGYFPMLTGLWSDCFETGAAWKDPNTFLYAPFICPFYPAYPFYGAFLCACFRGGGGGRGRLACPRIYLATHLPLR